MRLRVLIAGFLVLSGFVITPGSAWAFNQQITVYAAVPQMRNIYVDGAGIIIKIVGNTSQNIEPKVYDEHNQPVAMTGSISRQYQQFLNEHQGHIDAGKFYYINPVVIDNSINTQTIQVESNRKILSLSL
jgi:uncharacterized RmlC-like cupin family protein